MKLLFPIAAGILIGLLLFAPAALAVPREGPPNDGPPKEPPHEPPAPNPGPPADHDVPCDPTPPMAPRGCR